MDCHSFLLHLFRAPRGWNLTLFNNIFTFPLASPWGWHFGFLIKCFFTAQWMQQTWAHCTFIVPRGWVLITLQILSRFLWHYQQFTCGYFNLCFRQKYLNIILQLSVVRSVMIFSRYQTSPDFGGIGQIGNLDLMVSFQMTHRTVHRAVESQKKSFQSYLPTGFGWVGNSETFLPKKKQKMFTLLLNGRKHKNLFSWTLFLESVLLGIELSIAWKIDTLSPLCAGRGRTLRVRIWNP